MSISDTTQQENISRKATPTTYGVSLQQEASVARLAAVASCDPTPSLRILRLPEVMHRVGICRAAIYRRIAEGSFPRQISLGLRAVGWLESDIDAWLVAKIEAAKQCKK